LKTVVAFDFGTKGANGLSLFAAAPAPGPTFSLPPFPSGLMSNTEEADTYEQWADTVQAQVDAAGAAIQTKRDAIETRVAATVASEARKQHDATQKEERQHQQNVDAEQRRHEQEVDAEQRRHDTALESTDTEHALRISSAEAERDAALAALADFAPVDAVHTQIQQARRKAMSFRQLHILQGGSILDNAPLPPAAGGGRAVASPPRRIKGRENWASTDAKGLDDEKLFAVAPDSAEFQTVSARFAETMPTRTVDDIQRVENGLLHEMFTVNMETISRQLHPATDDIDAAQSDIRRTLFHGTRAVEQITGSTDGQGFLPLLAGTSTGAIYGDGTYFARDASYSDTYARTLPTGQKQMLLVDVIVGRWAEGQQGMKVCPTVPGEQYIRFNSLVNDTANPAIFVIQHSSQAYPTHLITYH
jgi:poly [ADP-ribose] polymerase 7/11/12/13